MSRDEAGKFSSGGGGSPAAVHSRVMAIRESKRAGYDAIRQRIRDARAHESEVLTRLTPRFDQLWSEKDPEVRVALREKLAVQQKEVVDPLSKAVWDAVDELDAYKAAAAEEMWTAIAPTVGSVVRTRDWDPSNSVRDKNPNIEEGARWVGRMVVTDAFDEPVGVMEEEGTREKGGAVNISMKPTSEKWVAVHELGHTLEDRDPEIHRAAVDFLASRTSSEADVRLADLKPNYNYDSDEVTRPDRFTDVYMGKQYRGAGGEPYATEIVSMGLQKIYQSPGDLAKRDPEYFKLMVGVMGRAKK
jgi:hypothetical protein